MEMGGFYMDATMDCEFRFFETIKQDSTLMLTCPSCENTVLWRGHFQSTGQEKSLNLSINGGEGVWFSTYCLAQTQIFF